MNLLKKLIRWSPVLSVLASVSLAHTAWAQNLSVVTPKVQPITFTLYTDAPLPSRVGILMDAYSKKIVSYSEKTANGWVTRHSSINDPDFQALNKVATTKVKWRDAFTLAVLVDRPDIQSTVPAPLLGQLPPECTHSRYYCRRLLEMGFPFPNPACGQLCSNVIPEEYRDDIVNSEAYLFAERLKTGWLEDLGVLKGQGTQSISGTRAGVTQSLVGSHKLNTLELQRWLPAWANPRNWDTGARLVAVVVNGTKAVLSNPNTGRSMGQHLTALGIAAVATTATYIIWNASQGAADDGLAAIYRELLKKLKQLLEAMIAQGCAEISGWDEEAGRPTVGWKDVNPVTAGPCFLMRAILGTILEKLGEVAKLLDATQAEAIRRDVLGM